MSDIFDIDEMTEEDIKLQYITPALLSKWDIKKITMETSPLNKFTDGKVRIKGNIPSRDKAKRCDYVLWHNKGTPLAIVEAKDNNHKTSYGMQQAISYGIMMNVPFVYTSNGSSFFEHDFTTGIEKELPLSDFPTAEELYNRWKNVDAQKIVEVENRTQYSIDGNTKTYDVPLLYDEKLLDYTEKDAFDVILMNPPYGGSEKEDIKQNFPADLRSSETADLFMAVIMYRLKKEGRAAVIVPDGFLFGNDNAKNNLKKKLLTDFNLHTIVRLPGSVFSPYTSITTNILFFNNQEPTGETWFYRVDIPSDRKHFSKTKPMELKHFDGCIAWWSNRTELLDSDGNPKAKKYTAKELLDNDCNFDLCGYPHEEEEILSIAETIQNYKKHSQAADEKISSTLKKITEILGIEM